MISIDIKSWATLVRFGWLFFITKSYKFMHRSDYRKATTLNFCRAFTSLIISIAIYLHIPLLFSLIYKDFNGCFTPVKRSILVAIIICANLEGNSHFQIFIIIRNLSCLAIFRFLHGYHEYLTQLLHSRLPTACACILDYHLDAEQTEL